MIIKLKFILLIYFFLKNLYGYEIIRDPIFEDYFNTISEELELNKIDVYLIKDKSANAFVINNKIYFTTGLLKEIKSEDTLKAIYLHEYGHVIKKHSQRKKIKLQRSKDKSNYINLFSIGMAVLSSNANVGVGTSITLNNNVVNEISKHSINFEIEADNFMINQIKKNKINTLELISFMNKQDDTSNNYFRTHPRNSERIYNLRDIEYKSNKNSKKFEWIKAKYSKNSNDKSFNIFFKELEKGKYDSKKKINKIDEGLIKYEIFKKGLYLEDWSDNFENLINTNNNSFLKIEYINYLLDNNFEDKYRIIENFKFNNNIMKEYFYYFIFGKYYNKIGDINLSNFYFCHFYKIVNSRNKADFFCKKYDIKNIPTLDKSYALFK